MTPRSGPLNVHTFEDIDGRRVEIDRRRVRDAHLHRVRGIPVVRIRTQGQPAVVYLGAGARPVIERWLRRRLEPLAVAEPHQPTTDHGISEETNMPTVTDQAWLDVRLAQLRDEAIKRLGPISAAREITGLAMVVLYWAIGPLPAQHKRAFELLKAAHAALVEVAGDGNDRRSDPTYCRAAMDEITKIHAGAQA